MQPFATVAPTPAEHFRLWFFAAVLRLIDRVLDAFDSPEEAFEAFPFLAAYGNQCSAMGFPEVDRPEAARRWCAAVSEWEQGIAGHLPLRALRRAAGLTDDGLTLLLAVGAPEEDPRFGHLFESVQGTPGQPRPTAGLLSAWWRRPDGWGEVRAALGRLREAGLTQVTNPDAPRLEQALHVPGPLWDALRGETHTTPAPGLRYSAPAHLATPADLILPEDTGRTLAALPALLAAGEAQAVIVRGPHHNGRRTALGAVARALGRGLLEVEARVVAEEERWRLVGPLATALNALPVAVLDVPPGESVALPPPDAYDGPIGVVLGREGGVHGPTVERAIGLSLAMPGPAARRLHWTRAFGARAVADLDTIAERHRITSGTIRRAADLAYAHARLAGRDRVLPADVQAAARTLHGRALDTLAAPVPPVAGWDGLAATDDTVRELRALVARCRHRERVGGAVGPALDTGVGAGVRALFSGPSGTGKTLAARVLAGALQMDLYRIDLAAVVNKYIGETEKNLDRVFARAEELDVILLLDEGDALLTGRTSVQNANDRYANLETNYLLQRLESFDGILIVTTNAVERIDTAFQRRMDVVVTFHPPGAAERRAIWQLHLPPAHMVAPALLDEIARRCELRGGQIRNAVLHAALLALDDGGPITSAHVEAAVQREYRKLGAVCPLRRPALSVNGRG